MSNVRKLSAFRQLSLNCSPTPEQRRKTLRKQFSEDIPDYKEKWIDPGIAWEENTTPDLKADEAVIIKKCKEVRRGSAGNNRLSRHGSLEKNSILHSKQELAERLKQSVKEKEPPPEKTNLKIFLAHNPKEVNEMYNVCPATNKDVVRNPEKPKLIQPLLSNNVSTSDTKNLFQIRRNFKPKINLAEISYSPTRTRESDTVVVVPMVENKEQDQDADHSMKPIDSIIIRPVTASSKRERFQKRTNSAFNATIKESALARPPLIRSSSAPTSKSERGRPKFSATKRKVKAIKRVQLKSSLGDGEEPEDGNKENPIKNQKELNRTTAVHGSEIVTMVSLVSPAGSDAEEESLEEAKDKSKSKSKTTGSGSGKVEERERDSPSSPKNMSLRKIVKSVSFQQSSIHAIRSFSASFPARRGSMATALMLSNNPKTTLHAAVAKVQEKRGTNTSTPDDDERVPKRRLLRSATQEKVVSLEESKAAEKEVTHAEENKSNFSVDIKTKPFSTPEETKPDVSSNNENPTEKLEEPRPGDGEKIKEDAKYETQKEKQCWEMYRKMTEKGINVSFDTILRGMLTPTEYRMSRKNIFVEAQEQTEAEPSKDE
ncbi:hypothetical protein NQ315_006292 [Exocentrus adspersus]|uniref:Uncharacterized protein n=1 Tax=Exocentrus adspersus TaxID=1586481 RepID=A0AAV8VZN8_9CUCU|nr:hypothetical protein NQ315_006292 [Exocentrus adspersus]